MVKPHQWLGVERIPGPRIELRAAGHVALASAAVLAVLVAIRALPGAAIAVRDATPRLPRSGEVRAIARLSGGGGAAPAAPASVASPPAEPAVSMALEEATAAEPIAPDREGGRRRGAIEAATHAGVLGAPGLDAAIARVAGDAHIGGAMAAVSREARASGWEPVDPQGCGERCFGGSLRTTKRECVFGEHLDEHGECVPDEDD